jgi:hypothetical protein
MSEAHVTTTAMVVMEPGSAWPGQVGDSTNLVAFSHGSDDLLRMTQAKLEVLNRAFLLSASPRAPLALTGQLTDELRGTTANISLRFTEGPHAGSAPAGDARALPMTGTHA